jgi:hypothetical protein
VGAGAGAGGVIGRLPEGYHPIPVPSLQSESDEEGDFDPEAEYVSPDRAEFLKACAPRAAR